jgi:hypothetical protein
MASSPDQKSPTRLADDKDPAVAKIGDLTTTSASEDSGSDEEFGELAKNPFLDPDVAAHWRQAYENAEYECRHVFDPTLTWTEEEEKRVIRKIDFRICAWAVCYLSYQLQSFSVAKDGMVCGWVLLMPLPEKG